MNDSQHQYCSMTNSLSCTNLQAEDLVDIVWLAALNCGIYVSKK